MSVAWAAAAAVVDPELPMLTIDDLGILRSVDVDGNGAVDVVVTPTYSGCPAVDAIAADITAAVAAAGFAVVRVARQLAPAWTTDWISDEGRRKLVAAGIAAPSGATSAGVPTAVVVGIRVRSEPVVDVACPQCGSADTVELSRFGSTACKALYRCRACLEPFDYFKVL